MSAEILYGIGAVILVGALIYGTAQWRGRNRALDRLTEEGTQRVYDAVVASGKLTIAQRMDIRMATTFAIHEAKSVADTAWEIRVEAGVKHPPAPAAYPPGTRVEVRDLFFATPARLKFLKTARSERDQAVDTVRRLAMACPGIVFTVIGDDERVLLRLPAAASREARLAALLGRDFAENSVPVMAERQGFRLTGQIGLPTLNRGLPRDQYLVVNGRPVRDKLLVGAVRGAYQDVLARDRHPVVALFLDGPAAEIDVNVHPA